VEKRRDLHKMEKEIEISHQLLPLLGLRRGSSGGEVKKKKKEAFDKKRADKTEKKKTQPPNLPCKQVLPTKQKREKFKALRRMTRGGLMSEAGGTRWGAETAGLNISRPETVKGLASVPGSRGCSLG